MIAYLKSFLYSKSSFLLKSPTYIRETQLAEDIDVLERNVSLVGGMSFYDEYGKKRLEPFRTDMSIENKLNTTKLLYALLDDDVDITRPLQSAISVFESNRFVFKDDKKCSDVIDSILMLTIGKAIPFNTLRIALETNFEERVFNHDDSWSKMWLEDDLSSSMSTTKKDEDEDKLNEDHLDISFFKKSN
jgi:hypothetical protein